MHIAPSGSPQPTKQAFICKLHSGFPRISSQQKPHRRICIPQGARNAVLRETQPRNLKSFFGDVFSQDKASKPPLYMHTARRKKRSFTGISARTSAHFSVMFFRKTRKISADVQAFFKRNLTPYSGNSARTSNHFSVMFFRKTRKMSADVQAFFKRNLTQYSEKPARTSNHFSAMFFRKTRKMSADVQAYFKRNLTQYCGKTARKIRFP